MSIESTDPTSLGDQTSEPEATPEARGWIEAVRLTLREGPLKPTERQRSAVLGRVLSEGDEESATNALSEHIGPDARLG